jgi:hypothetical protein
MVAALQPRPSETDRALPMHWHFGIETVVFRRARLSFFAAAAKSKYTLPPTDLDVLKPG